MVFRDLEPDGNDDDGFRLKATKVRLLDALLQSRIPSLSGFKAAIDFFPFQTKPLVSTMVQAFGDSAKVVTESEGDFTRLGG